MTPISAFELQLAADIDLSCYKGRLITSDMTPSFVAAVLQASCLTKKFLESDRATKEASDAALRVFLDSNERCRNWSFLPGSTIDEIALGEITSILDDFYHPEGLPLFNLTAIAERFAVGPGASVGAVDNSFLGKVFNSPLTFTDKSLYPLYRMGISSNPRWHAAEKLRYAAHGLREVPGENWSAVPKTSYPPVARSIGTQPTLNMLFQRGMGIVQERRLKERLGIDLSVQPELNRQLAMKGSIDGSFATVDLSDASGSISRGFANLVHPRSAMNWVDRARTQKARLPNGDLIDLHMVAAMGNGFTFPYQTIIFAAIAITSMRLCGIQPIYNSWCRTWRRWTPGNFGVFGDDIIVPTKAYYVLVHLLRLFGFRVNDDKSFFAGWFRESCGGDYWKGQNVRPIYVKSLRTPQDVYSALNRTAKWSAVHGVALDSVWSLLGGRFRKRLFTVPFIEGDTSGFKVPFTCATDISSNVFTRSVQYRAWEARTRNVDLTRLASAKKKLGYHINSNFHGSLTSLLGGFIRGGFIGLDKTTGPVKYKVRWRSIPSWDWIPEADLTKDQGERWKALAERISLKLIQTPGS